MDALSFPSLATPLQVLLVDLLLGADNALLIGFASRSLPARQRKNAAAFGVAGAVALRLLATVFASSLLTLPLVKLAGAVLLVIIALNLALDAPEGALTFGEGDNDSGRLWRAAAVIAVADAAMSLDNVVALAAIAQGNLLWLAIGVGLSLPVLGYGGLVVAEALQRAPGLAAFGAALLGWIAGGMAASDALWAQRLEANAPALAALLPAFVAAFVYLHSRWVPRPVALAPTVAAPRPRRAASMQRAVARPPDPIPPPAPAGELSTGDGRLVIVGLLLLFLLAGGFLAVAVYYGGVG